MYIKRQRRAKSASTQNNKKKSTTKKASRGIENQEEIENINIPYLKSDENKCDLESHKDLIDKKNKNAKKKNIAEENEDEIQNSFSDLDNNKEVLDDEEETVQEDKKKVVSVKSIKRKKLKRRSNSSRPIKNKKIENQNKSKSDENEHDSSSSESAADDEPVVTKKKKSKPILKSKRAKKNKAVKKDDNDDNSRKKVKSSNDDIEGKENIEKERNSSDDEPMLISDANESDIKSNTKDESQSKSISNTKDEKNSNNEINSTDDEFEEEEKKSIENIKLKNNEIPEKSKDQVEQKLNNFEDDENDSSSSTSFIDDSFDEPSSTKKYIIPELTQIKYNIHSNNRAKYAENVFYAFFGAHIETFFEISFFLTLISNKSVLEVNSIPTDQGISPISKYEEKEVIINIDDFIQCLSEQYTLKEYEEKHETESFSFLSGDIEDIINNYVTFMRNLIGELIYSDKIYMDCSAADAIKADLEESEMIPRLVILKVKDEIKTDEVMVKIGIESPDVETDNSISISYKLVWLIDEKGAYVRNDNGSLFYFHDGVCKKVEDINQNTKQLYACYSFPIG